MRPEAKKYCIHVYAQADDRLVWDIVELKLPVLQREVAALLQEE